MTIVFEPPPVVTLGTQTETVLCSDLPSGHETYISPTLRPLRSVLVSVPIMVPTSKFLNLPSQARPPDLWIQVTEGSGVIGIRHDKEYSETGTPSGVGPILSRPLS